MDPFDQKQQKFDKGIRYALRTGIIAGVISLLQAVLDTDRFFQTYLASFVFWMAIPLGGLALTMIFHLTGGGWGRVSRRVFEAATRTMPFMLLFFIPILIGMESIYGMWLHPDGLHADVIVAKTAYLNKSAWIFRNLIYFAIWIVFGYFITRWSKVQDRTGDPLLNIKLRKLSGVGLLIWSLTVTMASWDWTMSLEPAWFSSMWGPLFFAQSGLTTLAFTLIVLGKFHTVEPLASVIKDKDCHDLGNLTFAFVILWSYMTFSSFLIIWSANLPEGILWYQQRQSPGWQMIAVILTVFHFVLPFFLLLSRYTKLRMQYLAKIALCILLIRPLDIYWIVAPSYIDGVEFNLLDLFSILAVGGLWVTLFLTFYRREPLVALSDPRFTSEEVSLEAEADHV